MSEMIELSLAPAVIAPNRIRVFVYGTLMTGFGNHSLLKEARLIGAGETADEFAMIDCGGFPGACDPAQRPDLPAGPVTGELWEISAADLQRCHRLEGHPDWYKAEPRMIWGRLGGPSMGWAIIYRYLRPRPDADPVPENDWAAHAKKP